VVVATELLPEEQPGYAQPIVGVKLDVSDRGAFHEKKESNKKRPMTRQELQAYRRQKKGRGRKRK
jgi:uncharacterized short protein YbdD (DUF466 family)